MSVLFSSRFRSDPRNSTKPDEPVLQVENLKMDLSHRLVTINNEEVSLTPMEYDILRLLLQNARKVLTYGQLLKQVWGTAYEREMHLLRVNISNLRRKIEADPSHPHYLMTEPGVDIGLEYKVQIRMLLYCDGSYFLSQSNWHNENRSYTFNKLIPRIIQYL
jgi:DNA-binding winged helix-turn-helix (wHTH) protein